MRNFKIREGKRENRSVHKGDEDFTICHPVREKVLSVIYPNRLKMPVSAFASWASFFFSASAERANSLCRPRRKIATNLFAINPVSSIFLGIVTFIFLLALQHPVFADSMMLSPAELEAIGVRPDTPPPLEGGTKSDHKKPRLDGIIYQNEKSWCIWLNGQRLSSGQHPAHYKIINVFQDSVEIVPTQTTDSTIPPLSLRIGQP